MKARKVLALGVLAAIALLFSPSKSEATLLIDWGKATATKNTNLDLGSQANSGKTRTYSNVKSPTSDYSDTPFRGMLEQTMSTTGPANFSIARINATNPDYLLIRGSRESETPGSTTIRGLIYFEQAHFLNGGDHATVSLADDSTIALNIRKFNGSGSIRMAVFDGTHWYLSETSFSSTGLVTLTNFSSESWAAWSASSQPLPELPTDFPIDTSSLTNIQAFGFYFESTQPDITKYAELEFLTFKVDAVVTTIPEPSVAFLSGAAVLATGGWMLRRRRL